MALLDGTLELSVGAATSAVVNLMDVVLLMPAKLLPEVSSMAEPAI